VRPKLDKAHRLVSHTSQIFSAMKELTFLMVMDLILPKGKVVSSMASGMAEVIYMVMQMMRR
jgi:hypothetical protein